MGENGKIGENSSKIKDFWVKTEEKKENWGKFGIFEVKNGKISENSSKIKNFWVEN